MYLIIKTVEVDMTNMPSVDDLPTINEHAP